MWLRKRHSFDHVLLLGYICACKQFLYSPQQQKIQYMDAKIIILKLLIFHVSKVQDLQLQIQGSLAWILRIFPRQDK